MTSTSADKPDDRFATWRFWRPLWSLRTALRESDRRFRAIFDQDTAGMSVVERDGRFRTVNRRLCQITGYSELRLRGKTILGITHPDDSPANEALFADLIETGKSYTTENRLIRKDGQPVWVQVSCVPVCDDAGKTQYVIGLFLDIDDRKRAAAANAHLAAIVTSSGDAIKSLSIDGTILSWNDAAERLYGYTAAEAIGQSINLIVPEDCRDEFYKTVAAARVGEIGQLETVRRHKSGATISVSVDVAPIRDRDGNVIAISTIAHDITERKQIDAALQHSEQQFRTLTNSIPQLAWMTKADGRVVWYNERWYEYTGTAPEQMEGWGWQSVYDPAALPEVLDHWNRSLKTGEPFDMTISLKGADGVFRPFLTRALPLRDTQGRIACWFGTNTDITAQKEHEAHLNFVMRELSHRSKNLLAVVQAMARQTMRHSSDFDDFEHRFTGRLLGLARSHDLLVRGDWIGAPIRDLVRTQLAAFVSEEGASLELNGPDLALNPEAVQNLGFALFELATNAVKYGALSVPTGKVIVSWSFIEGGDGLRFVWREVGGPAVTQPARKGFGTVVIERFMSTAFGGHVSGAFEPEGFRWTLDIPGKHLMAKRSRHGWPWRKEKAR